MALFSFLLGSLVGAMFVVVYGSYQMTKLTKTRKGELINKLKESMNAAQIALLTDADKGNSIRDRLMQASKIAEVQNGLRAQAEMPSKNALHSRYKNGIILQVQELEAQKISILKTVLGDGFDPLITILREGGVQEEIPLSVYVSQSETQLNSMNPPTPGTTPEATPAGPRKAGKFVIYTGGRNDDGTTH